VKLIRKPQQHLINILRSTSQHHPNFTLFLGAGASVTSGIRHAGALIAEWREIYSEMHGEEELLNKYWYEKVNEYSELFESLYDQPSQRRELIETYIDEGVPSWGYIYLVNLLSENCFNTVFTTNFDDLLNEACYSYSKNLRPIVSAHDSSITSVRLTSPRPKIIKLHGDFLFDNIKNTVRELESLEDNMRSKFKQFASEFGMIVVGYAGNDRSIMDTLNTLLHTDTSFPHGIYWCVLKGAEISSEVENLSRFPRFHIVEIDGFDHFFAELHDSLGLQLQEEVSNPYASLASKLDNFVEKLNDDSYSSSVVIERDRQKLSDNIQSIFSANSLVSRIEETIKGAGEDCESDRLIDILKQFESEIHLVKGEDDELRVNTIPHSLLASVNFHEGRFEKSLEFSLKSLRHRAAVDAISIGVRAISSLKDMENFNYFNKKLSEVKTVTSKGMASLVSSVVDLISAGFYEEAIKFIDSIEELFLPNDVHQPFLLLNRVLSLKLLDRVITENLIEELDFQLKSTIDKDDNWLGFGLAICLGQYEVAYELANNFNSSEAATILARDMPIMKLVPEQEYEKIVDLFNLYVEAEQSGESEVANPGNVVHI